MTEMLEISIQSSPLNLKSTEPGNLIFLPSLLAKKQTETTSARTRTLHYVIRH